ncbi:helix-turn-helix domain-containing protein [Desulfofundulus australicus]|uniref:helix-turn-helix domain-containing protein n=1 Tax=Desulfofundulus australicus TaxID=1566 RepID=UPI000933341D|nr:helix-turn-helix domain-containing protein [Desulfofundulus australicus]
MAEVTNGNGKFAAFNQVIRDSTISLPARALYAILWSYADREGFCWPGIKVLAQETGYTERGVIKLLQELIEKGAIVKKRRGKTLTNVYSVIGTVVPVSDRNCGSGHKESDRNCGSYHLENEVNCSSPVIGTVVHSEVNCGSSENALPAYSGKASGEPIIPIKKPNENTNLNLKETIVSVGRKKSSKSNPKTTTTDERVQPVLKRFFETFKEHVGVEPTKTAFDWGRDGKRVKQLPESYSVELLCECIERFFKAPGFVRRNCTFSDFLSALPRLLTGDYKNQEGGKQRARTKWRPAPEPSKDWSDWEG